MCRYLLAILMFVASLPLYSQNDIIILRSGKDRLATIIQVDNQQTTFKSSVGNMETLDNVLIYMIKFEKRGNMFFNEKGERYSDGPKTKAPSDATFIYTVDGKEIVANNISMTVSDVNFFIGKGKKAKEHSISKNSVFLIKYPDGTRDLITEIEKKAEEEIQQYVVTEQQVNEVEQPKPQPKPATIRTKKGVMTKVLVYEDTKEILRYRKVAEPEGPIYSMLKAYIRSLKYN